MMLTFTPKQIESMRLDYINNFLTLERFAEYYNLTLEEAKRILRKELLT